MTPVNHRIAPIAPSLRQPFAARCGKKDKDTGAIIAPCISPIGGELNRPLITERHFIGRYDLLRCYCADGDSTDHRKYRQAAKDLMALGLTPRDIAVHLRIGTEAACQLLRGAYVR